MNHMLNSTNYTNSTKSVDSAPRPQSPGGGTNPSPPDAYESSRRPDYWRVSAIRYISISGIYISYVY